MGEPDPCRERLPWGSGYTETRDNDKDHIMVKIELDGTRESVTINTMIDPGVTEAFIDREVCNKQGIKMINAKNPT